MTITNSTLSGNSALNGGALYLCFDVAQTVVVDSILSGNQATDTNGLGGAVLVWDGAALTVQGTTFSGNTAPYYGGGLYNNKSAVTLENSVFSSNSGPLLGPLANNGGFTATHLPTKNSPAVDGGQCLAHIPTDQRGVARPKGAACDMGAVERREMENAIYLPLVVR